MVRLKDFHTGDVAYELNMHIGSNYDPGIKERTVVKTGRKYVTVNYYDRRFEEDPNPDHDNGLITSPVISGLYLFPERKQAEDFIERYQLALWINGLRVDPCRYSLEELQRVKEILDKQK
ncbi:MAG: hypothetical protein LUE86_13235 [Clostridiales bacterium]|nr:hypothetical protein [Clostridiales bacterium]